jgi:hypothetical protein
MSYDLTTDIGKVRLLTSDLPDNGQLPILGDHEVQAFLDLEGGNIKRAAAQILDVIAANEALTQKAIDAQDVKVDGPKLAATLQKSAAALREQADNEADGSTSAFEIVDFDYDAHTRGMYW